MPAPFAGAIRIPTEHEHADQSGDEWNRAYPTNVKIAPSGHAFEERRHPEPKNVTAAVTKEQTESQNDHRRMSQCLQDRHLLRVCLDASFLGQARFNPIPFV